jgi:hypothetical protein
MRGSAGSALRLLVVAMLLRCQDASWIDDTSAVLAQQTLNATLLFLNRWVAPSMLRMAMPVGRLSSQALRLVFFLSKELAEHHRSCLLRNRKQRLRWLPS